VERAPAADLMASWSAFEAEVPEFAARVRERLDAHRHRTLATLRADGSPRISGIECEIEHDELQFGSMWRGVKALDLLRDPRFALHSGTDEPDDWPGEAKVAGTVRAETRTSEHDGEQYHQFVADITEAVLVHLNEERTKLVVESWHEGRGLSRLER
jgi:pyridoxamine 5'-phosphate oxidase-like protein